MTRRLELPEMMAVLVIVLLLLLAALGAEAATNWCGTATTGNGSGSDLNNRMVLPNTTGFTRGDVYKVIEGTYSNRLLNEPASGTTLVSIIKVAASDSGIAGYSSTLHDGQVIFDNDLHVDTDYWFIDGVTGGGPGAWATGLGFRINGQFRVNTGWLTTGDRGNNVTLRRCEIDGTGTINTTPAISAVDVNNLTCSYIYSHDASECFVNTVSVRGGIFEYCYVPNFCINCSPAMHGEIFSWKYTGNLTIRWSIFQWVESTGGIIIANAAGDFADIYGNVIHRPTGTTWTYGGDGVVGGWIGRSDLGVWNMHVYNNTLINIPQSAMSGISYVSESQGMTPHGGDIVKNNYFYNSETGLPSGGWANSYNHYQDSGSTGETGETTGSGQPFVSVDITSSSYAEPVTQVAGDQIFPSIYRTDWFGNIGTYKGAIQGAQGPDTTGPALISATLGAYGTNWTLVFNEPARRGAAYSDTNLYVSASVSGASTLTWVGTESNATWTFNGSEVINSGETITLSIYQTNAAGNKIEDQLGNDYAGTTNFSVANNSGEGQVATPTFSFGSGSFYNPSTLELATVTSGADIYFTTDGSTPDSGDTEYTGAITIPDGLTTYKAIAIKAGSVDSAVATESYQVNTWTVSTPWTTFTVPASTNVAFRAVPGAGGIYWAFGLHTTIVNGSADLAGLVRFNSDGTIQAYDSSTWTATSNLTWAAGQPYDFNVTITPTNTYNATVNGIAFAVNYGLPANQLTAPNWDYVGMISTGGSTVVNNMTFDDAGSPPPPASATATSLRVGILQVNP